MQWNWPIFLLVSKMTRPSTWWSFACGTRQRKMTVSHLLHSRSQPWAGRIVTEENDGVTPPPALVKKATITRATVTAAQLHHVARMKKMKDYNIAFKRAAIMHAREKGKGKSGMSARSVAELIKISQTMSPDNSNESQRRRHQMFATEARSKREHSWASLQKSLCCIQVIHSNQSA